MEPVTVAWNGLLEAIEIKLPAEAANSRVKCRVALETGDLRHWELNCTELPPVRTTDIEGTEYQKNALLFLKNCRPAITG